MDGYHFTLFLFYLWVGSHVRTFVVLARRWLASTPRSARFFQFRPARQKAREPGFFSRFRVSARNLTLRGKKKRRTRASEPSKGDNERVPSLGRRGTIENWAIESNDRVGTLLPRTGEDQPTKSYASLRLFKSLTKVRSRLRRGSVAGGCAKYKEEEYDYECGGGPGGKPWQGA